jgi:hypothetical protein
MRPGVEITITDQPAPATIPTGTDLWFCAGITEKGPVATSVEVRSMRQYEQVYGARQPYATTLYDSLSAYFGEGGGRARVTRVVGAAAAAASGSLDDASSAPSLDVTAASPGEWGNALSVQATQPQAGTSFQLIVSQGGSVVETSPEFTSLSAAASWSQASAYVRVVPAGTLIPAPAASEALSGGSDDRAAISQTDWAAALDLFDPALGPGQVSLPGNSNTAAMTALLQHGLANSRYALCDAPDTDQQATLTSLAAQLRQLGDAARWGSLLTPWGQLSPFTDLSQRIIPPCGIVAGIIARNTTLGTGQASAGVVYGRSNTLLALNSDWSATRDVLNEAGIMVIREVYDEVANYGFRTLADPASDAVWREATGTRTVMAIKAQAEAIAERYVFATLDGRGLTIAAFGGELDGMLLAFFQDNSLYGATPQDAYRVNVGAAVNTPETIANDELHAQILLRTSPFAELVVLEIVKQPITSDLGVAA